MIKQKRIRDYGVTIGNMETGKDNKITDVPGVRVGHITLNEGEIKTGVTAILPHDGNLFKHKVLAATHVINGFGKTIGTVQIDELGVIETPILLTNTLNVGIVGDALVEYMLQQNEDIGITTGTVNPVVGECNDAYLNDIRGRHIKKQDVLKAIENAGVVFEEGAVGAGTGMSCYHLKGGIGSASRRISLGQEAYTVGILTLSNFGEKKDLIVDGIKAGKIITELEGESKEKDKGSVMIILATDLPLSERQLKRICKRAAVGLSRTGTYLGNGSGDIVIGFTTANQVKHYEEEPIIGSKAFNENKIDLLFRAVMEATEEAVLNSMICADTTVGRNQHKRISLKEYIDKILENH